jgi:antitoxin ParD1/3/4
MSRKSTLNVSLTPALLSYVKARVKSGRYESASEVVRESLRVLEVFEKLRGKTLAQVDEAAPARSRRASAKPARRSGRRVLG